MYTQGKEEECILTYFKNKQGTLLEIGSYHPTIFSNSRALIENGWDAILVEPSPKCYNAIRDFYKDSEKVITINTAIGSVNGKIKFYDSAGAVGTASKKHYEIWKETQKDFEETFVDCVSWETFYSNYPYVFDFISIDTEGMDYEILKQINLNTTKTSMVCIEYTYNKLEIINYLNSFGLKVIFENGENLIAVR